MPDLVDGLTFGYHELTFLESFGLVEETDLVGRVQEIAAEAMGVFAGRGVEDSCVLWLWLESINEPIYFRNGRIAFLRGKEILDDRVAVEVEMGHCLPDPQRKHTRHGIV